MLFSVVCPTCQAKIGVHDQRLVGQLVQCPKCGSFVQLSPPEKSTEPVKPVPPAAERSGIGKRPVESESAAALPPTELNATASPLAFSPVIPPAKTNSVVPPPVKKQKVPVPPVVEQPAIVPPELALAASDSCFSELPVHSIAESKGDSIDSDSILSQFTHVTPPPAPLPEPMAPEPINASGSGLSWGARLASFVPSRRENNPDTVSDSDINSEINSYNTQKPDFFAWLPFVIIGLASIALIVLLACLWRVSSAEKEEAKEPQTVAEPKTERSVVSVKEPEVPAPVPAPVSPALPGDEFSNIPDPFAEPPVPAPAENAVEKAPASDVPLEVEEIADNSDALAEAGIDPDDLADSEPNAAAAQEDALPPGIQNGLNTKIAFLQIERQTLSQCLQFFKDLGALNFEIDWAVIERMGAKPDDKVSFTGKEVKLEDALIDVLSQRGLMYKIESDGKLRPVPLTSISARSETRRTPDASSLGLVKIDYNILDLVGVSVPVQQNMVKSMERFLCPGDWVSNGGVGKIVLLSDGTLQIVQSVSNHWIISDFLDRLRIARRLAPVNNKDVTLDLMSVRAKSALSRNVGMDFTPSTGLKDALNAMGKKIGVSLTLDEAALKRAGISPLFPVTLNAEQLSLEQFFLRINEETKLVYCAQTPTSFILTTPEGMNSLMCVEIFPIADLIQSGLAPTVLIQSIQTLEPNTWKKEKTSGAGIVEFDPASDSLIIRQNTLMQSKIAVLLSRLRNSK